MMTYRHIFSSTLILLTFVFLVSLLTGCANIQTGCRITVANASTRYIESAVIKDNRGVSYAFPAINPHATALYLPVSTNVAGPLVLTLTSTNGIPHRTTVEIPKSISSTFNGRILLQVEKDHQIRFFLLPDRNHKNNSDMPWAIPPSWQVAPGIPGLPGE